MNINRVFDKFVNSRTLSTSIFVGSGVYKMYSDYNNASNKYKDSFLIKDSVVLTGAALGIFGCNIIAPRLLYKIPDKNITTEIAKDLLSGFATFSTGIIGALSADFLLTKCGFKQPELKETPKHKNKFEKYLDKGLDKITNEKTKEAMYARVTDMPQMQIFSNALIGVHAINLAKDREADKRLKHTTKFLINNSLLPLFFLSVSSAFTKNMNPMMRIPIIFGSLVGGTLGVNQLIEKYVKKH